MSRALHRAVMGKSRAKPLLAIIGPTGTGKSQVSKDSETKLAAGVNPMPKLAVDLARRFNGEIINADALQLYRGLPIATNKLRPEEMRGVPHHLIGCIDVSESPWTVGRFVHEADNLIREIHARNRLPVIVGGTHYYIHSLLSGNTAHLQDQAQNFQGVKSDLQHQALQGSAQEMLEELRRIDPVAATWWHPQEPRKIRRSLEICLQTGRKVSEIYREQQPDQGGGSGQLRYNALCIYLYSDRDKLIQRLNARVDHMLQAGLLEEVRLMRDEKQQQVSQGHVINSGTGIWIAIGFKEFEAYIDFTDRNGSQGQAEVMRYQACERTKISTRQYARRQSLYIRNKILPLYQNAEHCALLQPLDVTDITHWDVDIASPASDLVQKYLRNEQLGAVQAMNATGLGELLVSPQHKITRHCDTCNVTTTTHQSWKRHVESRRHSSAVRKPGDMRSEGNLSKNSGSNNQSS